MGIDFHGLQMTNRSSEIFLTQHFRALFSPIHPPLMANLLISHLFFRNNQTNNLCNLSLKSA